MGVLQTDTAVVVSSSFVVLSIMCGGSVIGPGFMKGFCVLSSFIIILLRKNEQIALLYCILCFMYQILTVSFTQPPIYRVIVYCLLS